MKAILRGSGIEGLHVVPEFHLRDFKTFERFAKRAEIKLVSRAVIGVDVYCLTFLKTLPVIFKYHFTINELMLYLNVEDDKELYAKALEHFKSKGYVEGYPGDFVFVWGDEDE